MIEEAILCILSWYYAILQKRTLDVGRLGNPHCHTVITDAPQDVARGTPNIHVTMRSAAFQPLQLLSVWLKSKWRQPLPPCPLLQGSHLNLPQCPKAQEHMEKLKWHYDSTEWAKSDGKRYNSFLEIQSCPHRSQGEKWPRGIPALQPSVHSLDISISGPFQGRCPKTPFNSFVMGLTLSDDVLSGAPPTWSQVSSAEVVTPGHRVREKSPKWVPPKLNPGVRTTCQPGGKTEEPGYQSRKL
jgi:hypothetical protein